MQSKGVANQPTRCTTELAVWILQNTDLAVAVRLSNLAHAIGILSRFPSIARLLKIQNWICQIVKP